MQRAEQGGVHFSEKDKQIIYNTICPGANKAQFLFVLAACERMRLDPFLKQVHAVKRWTKETGESITLQIGIDGYLTLAERTGEFEGTIGPWYYLESKQAWVNDDEYLTREVPVAAKYGVKRTGRAPQYSVARYDEYVQTTRSGDPNQIWAKRPGPQLAKCALSLALRLQFPQELGGLRTDEEMGHTEQSEGNPQLDSILQDFEVASAFDKLGVQEANRIKFVRDNGNNRQIVMAALHRLADQRGVLLKEDNVIDADFTEPLEHPVEIEGLHDAVTGQGSAEVTEGPDDGSTF